MKFRQMSRQTRHLACRAWTEAERRIVWRGLTGRMSIAVEPFLGMIFFALLAYGVVWRSRQPHVPDHDIWILWPVFGVVALAFAAYFFAVMLAPFIAYAQTFKPIYIVDGYVRYRPPDEYSEFEASGYVAVLFEDQCTACEWECFGKTKLPELTLPAMTEFSEYAGIHKIDGRSTGVLPETDLPLLAIGIAPRR
jgi:hypothetical protein